MTDLINKGKTSFITGRRTQGSIRRTLQIINWIQTKKDSAAIISLDAEKAFHSVDWSFLYAVLERFGFNRNYAHITPVLANLHWLPVKYPINFKILLLTFKILNHLAPSYLCERLHLYIPNKALRSSNQMLLTQPRPRLKSRGDRAFAAVAPRLWNNLPPYICSSESIQSFNLCPKTYYFSPAFDSN